MAARLLRTALLLLPLAAPGLAAAQGAGAVDERERIRAEVRAAQEEFAEAAQACQSRFTVTDCVDEARRRRTERLQRLRAQEALIGAAERRSRTERRAAAIREKRAEAERRGAASAPSGRAPRMRAVVRDRASAPAAASAVDAR